MKKTIQLLSFVFLFCGVVAFSSVESYANATWDEGKVTRNVWGKNPERVEIDNVEYWIEPGSAVYRIVLHQDKKGFDMKTESAKALRKGMMVNVKSFGPTIYQIEILP
jgi:hypothetical protein